MTVEEIVRNRLGVEPERIAEFCRKWQIKELALFGSALGDDFRADSDVDLLVTFQDPHRSFGPWMGELQEMEEELEKLFGRKVDFVEKRLIKNPFRRHHILTTQQVIYAA
jgi:predicted nucleotidyltransferase